MCDQEQSYRLKVDEKLIGSVIRLKDAPELTVLYAAVRNSLCPSRYRRGSNIRCVWEGDVALTLMLDGEAVVLNDHDAERGDRVLMNGYVFIGQGIEIDTKTEPEDTYFHFTVCKLERGVDDTVRRYKLHEPFLLNLSTVQGTGYTWQLTLPTEEAIVLLNKVKSLPHGTVNPVGANTTHSYLLRGNKRGTWRIVAHFSRSWVKTEMPGDKTVVYQVTIV